ncbi:hypothetical protein HMPREF9318_01006 [Streptococcus urinalis FB127-CNA-2]|uniref:Transporter associated domain protein n=1 Tax=Streptococcus urinalis 2285-97 TaxID=764291 RepID=G5KH70_9STRE|nr:hypothetical protein [Streptococcus urinalis]EHJ56721.1 hypothetical protein STRUR_0163 [Streptococcus urinalis 2285-97]EKS21052.1 hypothetical protein HMPREF9318_01006 [Streptococcus urinalis FB127-CNA-2]VEF31061.1 membrane protein [Streptococcus urinalis]
MRKFLQTTLYEISFYIEIFISMILILVLGFLSIRLIFEISTLTGPFKGEMGDYLQAFLNEALSIAIGVELVKMLSKHTSGTIIEVLLFAIARQLVISHGSAKDSLISVLALAVLFATRKYLFTNFDDSNNIIVRASQKVKIANLLARVNLKAQKGELLRDFMVRHLEEEEKSITIGSTIYFKDTALRIDSMKDGIITRVEIIKALY